MQRDGWVDTLDAVFESIADNDAPEQSAPTFFVETDSDAQVVLSARGADGWRAQLSVCTSAEALLREVEIDYTRLRDEVMRLWETYPLDGTDRAGKKKELARLSEEVREASELLRGIDPLGYFYVRQRLEQERPMLDAALASEDADLADMGARLLHILEVPALAQVRLRNLFEVAFDGMERVERSIDFDPWLEYRGMMALDLATETPSWEITSAEEQTREAQGEHRSLREKYGKK